MKIETRIYSDPEISLRAYTEGEERIIEGYAARYNVESRYLYDNKKNRMFTEIIERGAFSKVVNDDVYLTFNHNKDTILARTINKTLELKDDEKGLFFRAKLNNTTDANNVYEMVSRGDVNENSFGFYVEDKDMKYERSAERVPLRRISRIANLFDVSVVTKAAYPQTEVYARGLEEFETETKEIKSELNKLLEEEKSIFEQLKLNKSN